MPTVHGTPDNVLAVTVGATAHLSARTAPSVDGKVVGDLPSQVTAAWGEVAAQLDAVDLGRFDVVRVVEFVTFDALGDYQAVEEARAAALGDHRPAVSTVAVHGLPTAGAKVALEITADGEGSAAAMPLGAAGDDDLTGLTAPIAYATNARRAYATAAATDDLVYVSSVLPLDANGDVVGGDDLVAQTAKIYANAAVALAQMGLGLEDVVKTVEFVKPHVRGDYPKTGFVRKQHLAAPYGGGTGIVMDELAHPDALMQVDFVASAAPRRKVDCGWARYGKLTYNPGLEVGDRYFVMSGQAALDIETEEAVLAGDVVAQARYTYENILRVLEFADLSPEHLIRSVEYVTPAGLDRYDEVAAVRREIFGAPAVTSVVCSGLLRPEFEIEIDPTAVRTLEP